MNRLREYRLAHDLSQEELATRAQCTRAYISSVERGVKRLSMRMAKKFSKVLNVDPYELLGTDAIRYKGDFFTTLRNLLTSCFDEIIEDGQKPEEERNYSPEDWERFWIIFDLANTSYTLDELKSIAQLVRLLKEKYMPGGDKHK